MTLMSKTEILQYLEINEEQFEELKHDQEKLKKLYRLLAKKKHPDAGGSNEDFANMQNAYEALRDGNYYEPSASYEYSSSYENTYGNTYDNSYTYNDNGYEYHGPADKEEGFRRAYEEYQTKHNKKYRKEKIKKAFSWYVLWLLRGLVYGVLWIFSQLIDISTAIVGLLGLGVIGFSGLSIVLNWGEPHLFEIMLIIVTLVAFGAVGWFAEKKDDLLFEVWKWWQL